MTKDTLREDAILSQIGLKRKVIQQSPFHPFYAGISFRYYVTSEYRNSARKETDEFYRIFEFELLHSLSGLRLVYATSESYDGEQVSYTFVSMYILTNSGNKLDVLDINFKKELFYTPDAIIPFKETSKAVEE